MAKKETDPLATLTEEARARLDAMKEDLDKSEETLKDLEELGLDVSRLKERVSWAKRAREIILKHTICL